MRSPRDQASRIQTDHSTAGSSPLNTLASGQGAPEPFDLQGLLQADAFPHAVTQLALKETHISRVILTGEFAYKIKKAVHYDFVDTRTLAERKRLCEEELRLNRRLAPELYIDVMPVTRQDARLHIGGQGTPVEYALRMRQFPANQELPALLEARQTSREDIEDLATTLAKFHAGAASSSEIDPEQFAVRTQATIFENIDELRHHIDPDDATTLDALDTWLRAQWTVRAPTLKARVRAGFIRECHGDLHAGNIVKWRNRLVPFDCIEFHPALRYIDVIDDVSFLFMDLIARARADLAFAFINQYLEESGDYAGLTLLRWYAVHRALVRAKVDALLLHDPQRTAEMQRRLRRRLAVAAELSRPTVPTLVLMHGVSGSGKSWLSHCLIPLIPAVRIRSDVERQRLLAQNSDSKTEPCYSANAIEHVYERLRQAACDGLRAGFNVIVDATFLAVEQRRKFRELAEQTGAGCKILSCHAERSVLEERVLRRHRSRQDASEADASVLANQLHQREPLLAEEESLTLHINTAPLTDCSKIAESLHSA